MSIADGSREPGTLEDSAAQYLVGPNEVEANRDFMLFTELLHELAQDFTDAPAEELRDVMELEFATQMALSVLTVQQFERKRTMLAQKPHYRRTLRPRRHSQRWWLVCGS